MKLIQDFTSSVRADEAQLQQLLQVVEKHRKEHVEQVSRGLIILHGSMGERKEAEAVEPSGRVFLS